MTIPNIRRFFPAPYVAELVSCLESHEPPGDNDQSGPIGHDTKTSAAIGGCYGTPGDTIQREIVLVPFKEPLPVLARTGAF